MSEKSHEVYTPGLLNIYDLLVLGFSNTWAWRCPTKELLRFYQECLSNNHLDVGVGTGWYPAHLKFAPDTRLALMDCNPNCLREAESRISHLRPTLFEEDIRKPLRLRTAPFQTISLFYLLHCLPGTMAEKALVFDHLKPYLQEGGLLFGATILGKGVQHNVVGRRLMSLYNGKGIFSNSADSTEELEAELKKRFPAVSLSVRGCVALFRASH